MGRLGAAIALLVLGCGSSESTPVAASSSSSGAGGGGPRCEAGTLDQGDGTCLAAGVPEDACAEGFVHQGDGCEPVLPAEPCMPGQMAIPGETACHDLVACPDPADKWGGIPVDAKTKYVDASFFGVGFGTQAKPYQRIQDAIYAAPKGGIIAVAAGTYPDPVLMKPKPTKIWGVCPQLVEIVAAPGNNGVTVLGTPTGVELHQLSITGGSMYGLVALSGSPDLLLDKVWIHDSPQFGIFSGDEFGDGNIILRDSLVERLGDMGIGAFGVGMRIERSVIRDTAGGFSDGVGVNTGKGKIKGGPAHLTVVASVIERTTKAAVIVSNAEAEIEGSVIQDTAMFGGIFGRGVSVEGGTAATSCALRHSVLRNNAEMGMLVAAAHVEIEASVIRDTRPADNGMFGRALTLQPLDGKPSDGSVRSSLFSDNTELGVIVFDSTLTVDATIVRGTKSRPLDGWFGSGLGVTHDPTATALAAAKSELTIRGSRLESNRGVGAGVAGGKLVVEGTFIGDTQPRDADAGFGDGLVAANDFGACDLTVQGSRIEGSSRAGVSSFGCSPVLQDSVFECNDVDLDGEPQFDAPGAFDDRGGNTCGCAGKSAPCKVLSSGLSAPPPI